MLVEVETKAIATAEMHGTLKEAEPIRAIDPNSICPVNVFRKQRTISGRAELMPRRVRLTIAEFHDFLAVITEIASFIRSVMKAIPTNRYIIRSNDVYGSLHEKSIY